MNLLVLINISIGLLTLSQGMLLYLFLCIVPAQSAKTQAVGDNTASVAHIKALPEQVTVQAETPAPTEALLQSDSALLLADDANVTQYYLFLSPHIKPLLRIHTERAPPLAMV